MYVYVFAGRQTTVKVMCEEKKALLKYSSFFFLPSFPFPNSRKDIFDGSLCSE